MSEEHQEQVKDRLSRLKKPTQSSRNFRVYIVPAATLVVGVGLGIYLMMPKDKANATVGTLPSSTVTEFQQDLGLAGFTTTPEPAPVPETVTATGPQPRSADRGLAELTERLAAMEQENKSERDRLQQEIEAEKARNAEKDAALAEAEEERRMMEEQLLNAAQLGATDPSAAEAEAQRLADLEARRQEAADLRKSQIASPIIAFSAGGNRASGGPGQGQGPDGADYGDAGAPAPDFLRAGAQRVEVTRAEVIANPGSTIVQGTMIEATLETSIDSSLPGNVAANVSQDVWSMDMSRILIPRGSKLYGRYSAEVEQGQRRVMIAWDRIVRSDGMSVQLEGYGTDRVGRSGLTGKVNNHTLSRFGAAAMVSVVGALPAILEAAVSDDDDSNNNNNTGQIYSGIGQGASGAVSEAMGGYLNRKPTITIQHGQVVIVRVNKDMEIY